jgi:hypothetical protein
MGSIGETVSGWWSKLTGKSPQESIAPIPSALPSGPDMGTAAEPAGYTSAGGKRLKKTRSASKKRGGRKHRKTARKH